MSENKLYLIREACNKMYDRLKIYGCLRDNTGPDANDLKKIIIFIKTKYKIEEDDEIISELYNDNVSLEMLFNGIFRVIDDIEDEITKANSILNILYVIHKITTTYAIIRKQN